MFTCSSRYTPRGSKSTPKVVNRVEGYLNEATEVIFFTPIQKGKKEKSSMLTGDRSAGMQIVIKNFESEAMHEKLRLGWKPPCGLRHAKRSLMA